MKEGRRKFLKIAGGALGAAALVEVGARTRMHPFKGFAISKPDPDLNEILGELPEDSRDRTILRMSELDRLPWFDKDDSGVLTLAANAEVPPVIDAHTHVGWSQGIGSDIDMTARGPVSYFFDHETPQNLLHVQMHPTATEGKTLSRETLYTPIRTPARNQTHTAANLLAEMERFNHRHSVLLPVEIPIHSRHLEQTLRAARLDDRLLPFSAIHPSRWSEDKASRLDETLSKRARGIKFHPIFQFMAPDAPEAMALFEWCAENDIVVLTHTGFTGREPGFLRALSEPERFSAPLNAFPKLKMIFAHTGSRARFHETLAVAKRHEDQVWLEFSGQPVPNIKTILDNYDPQKIVYGSDWPYYPLAVALARFMVATKGREHQREPILRDNFAKLMKLDTA